MVTRRPAPNLRGTLTWLYVRGEFLMTILNFFGGSEIGGEGPSYHCAGVGVASNGLRPTPSAMRLKSRRFILSSYHVNAPLPRDRPINSHVSVSKGCSYFAAAES